MMAGFGFVSNRRLHLLQNQTRLWGLPWRLASSNSDFGATLESAFKPRSVEAKIRMRKDEDEPAKSGIDIAMHRCARPTFRMILPPPNVTGSLHLGHALMATIQDVICRQRRQIGFDVQWIPGTDHAGIATQVVVEKKLLKERNLNRHEIGRDAFLQEVWKWKQEKGDGIVDDLERLGCTLNWDKQYFTMDKQQAHAVNVAFIRLFEEGLIRRQKSLVNWSCALESAISDIEVETLELSGPTEVAVPGYAKNIIFGRLYNIAYRLCDSNEEIVVSTTRPETLLGDVAVAVHPLDERFLKYRDLPEIKLWHPFRHEPIPLIFDVGVEREFGTGAVKLTPAHDKNDFAMADRHRLDARQVFTEQGKVSGEFAQFAYLPRFEARERILNSLAKLELLRSVQSHSMTLPICSRSKDVIEYMVRPQWFLHCQPMADAALAEVRSGRLRIVPSNFELEWHRWLHDCHDWCISRQLWWGHQIPAYFAVDTAGNRCWVAALDEADARKKASVKLNTSYFSLQRDADVLDTWFSSSLLPLSAYGWPEEHFREHYPLDLMETGHDILFFWVARMVMLGLHLTGEIPFRKVLLNGIVCDAHGHKMSKSLGNVVTPQQVVLGATVEALSAEVQKSFESGVLNDVERKKSLKGLQKMFPKGIQECGTDALRFTLCSHNIQSHFINFDVAECYTNKLFLNKIWQATRYTIGAAHRLKMSLFDVENMNHVELGKWDRWILSRLANTLKICADSFESYNLHAATAALKNFFYSNYCDVYLETTKDDINDRNNEGFKHCATLVTCLSWGLQAMMPFTPFVARELLLHLPQRIQLNLNRFKDPQLELEIGEVLAVCQFVRQQKSRHNITKRHEPQLHLHAQSSDALALLLPHLKQIKILTQTSAVELDMRDEQRACDKAFACLSTAGHLCAFGIATNNTYRVSDAHVDSSKQLNQQKLNKLQAELERYRLRVESDGFRKSASEQVQLKHLKRIKQLEVEIANIKDLSR